MSTVALIQLVSSSDVQANLEIVQRQLETLRESNIELIVLPENFAFMGLDENAKLAVAESFNKGIIQDTLSGWAQAYNFWIVAGSVPIQYNQSKIKSSCLVFDEKGKCAARYDKVHLFDVQISDNERYLESNTIEAGNKLVVVDTPIGRIGLTICYDLRFPELFRQLAVLGAEIFTVPSAFTAATGRVHWEVLLRARAIENLSYVLAANQGGLHENQRTTYGHSMVVSPWGEILAEAGEGNQTVINAIDLKQQYTIQQQFPCKNHHVL